MILFIITIACLLVFSPVSNAISIPIGEKAPEFSLLSADGGAVTRDQYKEKALIFVFWRTDQKRSLEALQDANDIYDQYSKKGIEVIGVIEESDSLDEAKKIFADHNIKFPMLIDEGRKAYGDFGIRVYPTTVIIDKEGVLAYDIPSHPLTYKTKLQGYVKKLIGEIDDEQLRLALSPKKEEKDEAMLEAERKYNLAMKFVQMRMIDQAIASAQKAVEAKPDMAKSHILLGFLYLHNNEADNAISSFDNALKIHPDSNDAKTGKGGAFVLKGEPDTAIQILEEAAVANPYAQMTYYELGKAHELKGEKDKALSMYKKAIEKIVQKKILPSSISQCQ